MKKLIINDGERVIPYVDQAIGGREHLPLDSFCIGITDDTGELQGGVVYTSFDGVGVTLHSAGKTRMWLNRMFLKAVFSYPFYQLKCRRLTTIVRADNPHASVVAEKAGFTIQEFSDMLNGRRLIRAVDIASIINALKDVGVDANYLFMIDSNDIYSAGQKGE